MKLRSWTVLAFFGAACGGHDFYEPCDEAAQCDDLVPEGVEGECVEKTDGGFCSWSCTVDADCDGDRDDNWDFVCAPFESTPGTYCFPACLEDEDDDTLECPSEYTCRSTGGGSDNEKICFPE